MLLVMKRFGNYPARLIPNIADCIVNDQDELVWKIGHIFNKFRKGIPVATMEQRYWMAYGLCGTDSGNYGVGESMLKWFVWKNYWVGDMYKYEVDRYIKRNPIQ